jgi:hypothetical protein
VTLGVVDKLPAKSVVRTTLFGIDAWRWARSPPCDSATRRATCRPISLPLFLVE